MPASSTTTADDLLSQAWKPRQLPGYIGAAGPLWTKREGDAWAYGLLASEQHLNPAGIVHGGALTTLVDHALSTVAWQACERTPCVTLQLDMHFMHSVTVGQFALARAHVVRSMRSLLFMRAEVAVNGHLVASAQAIVKRLGEPAGS